MRNRSERILDIIEEMYPDAQCELDYQNVYQLTVAVILSAQTTDISVNKITPKLFAAYPDVESLSKAEYKDVEAHLKQLGLFRNKAKNIILFAQQVVERYDGQVPGNKEDLVSLAGVGDKTANVVLSEYFKVPAIAVDTHVERVSKRLKIVREGYSVLETERRLERALPRERWSQAHHSLIIFGRYQCMARNPQCDSCRLTDECKYFSQKAK